MQIETVAPDSDEQAKHLSAIQHLSEENHLPADTVADLYERELTRIRQDALITTYLSIFVSRRVNEMLRTLESSTSSIQAPAPSPQ
jgi:hypothetical protein